MSQILEIGKQEVRRLYQTPPLSVMVQVILGLNFSQVIDRRHGGEGVAVTTATNILAQNYCTILVI